MRMAAYRSSTAALHSAGYRTSRSVRRCVTAGGCNRFSRLTGTSIASWLSEATDYSRARRDSFTAVGAGLQPCTGSFERRSPPRPAILAVHPPQSMPGNTRCDPGTQDRRNLVFSCGTIRSRFHFAKLQRVGPPGSSSGLSVCHSTYVHPAWPLPGTSPCPMWV